MDAFENGRASSLQRSRGPLSENVRLMQFSSFGFTTQQAEAHMGAFLSGIIVGIVLTICATALAVVIGVKINL